MFGGSAASNIAERGRAAVASLAASMVLAVACASSGGAGWRADLEAVLSLGLQEVEHGTAVIVAIPASLDPSVVAAVSKLRRVVRRADVPRSEEYELPTGYFALEMVRIAGETAIFAGRLGPVPRQRPGLMIDACGTGFRISMERRGGRWFVGPVEIGKC
jgi:hypothetical protein